MIRLCSSCWVRMDGKGYVVKDGDVMKKPDVFNLCASGFS